ncbi:MAG: glycosyltransferase family 4 protein [Deltaproteobacteria bacterium]|nr:glycosyltransferase family 4 protein [Deltaproteobacteria bacterium]
MGRVLPLDDRGVPAARGRAGAARALVLRNEPRRLRGHGAGRLAARARRHTRHAARRHGRVHVPAEALPRSAPRAQRARRPDRRVSRDRARAPGRASRPRRRRVGRRHALRRADRGAHPHRRGDAITVLGTRGDVAAIYADLDVAVHPSLSENCGGAVESLAAGCPTVATAVGGLPDLVRDGETGWLVPARDPAGLAGAVIAALGDRAEARRRALAGRAHVRSLFAIERTAAEIAALYARVLADVASSGEGVHAGSEMAASAPAAKEGAYACTG